MFYQWDYTILGPVPQDKDKFLGKNLSEWNFVKLNSSL